MLAQSYHGALAHRYRPFFAEAPALRGSYVGVTWVVSWAPPPRWFRLETDESLAWVSIDDM